MNYINVKKILNQNINMSEKKDNLSVISSDEKELFFTHFSKNPIEEFLETSNENNINMKPKGLYFSINHEWMEYLLININLFESKETVSTFIKPTNTMYYINSLESDKILHISSNEDAEIFGKLFRFNFGLDETYPIFIIDWDKVSKLYDGIYVENPNSYDYGHCFVGWDVSTLVIWSKKNTNFNLVKDNSLINTYVNHIFDSD